MARLVDLKFRLLCTVPLVGILAAGTSCSNAYPSVPNIFGSTGQNNPSQLYCGNLTGLWSNIDAYNFTNGEQSLAAAAGYDTTGTVYAVGFANNAGGQSMLTIQSATSTAAASVWSTTYQGVPTGVSGVISAQATSIANDNSGSAYIAGYASTSSNNYGLVGKVTGGGTPSFTYVSASIPATLNSISYGGSQFWVAGKAGSATLQWNVKSSSSAVSWVDSETFYLSPGQPSEANSILSVAGNEIYAAGSASDSISNTNWVVRKFTTGWSTLDQFLYPGGTTSLAKQVFKDSLGNLYVVGQAADSSGVFHWLTRKSSNLGSSWATVDDYQYATGQLALGESIAQNPVNGFIYAAGIAADAAGSAHLLLRVSQDGGNTWCNLSDTNTGLSAPNQNDSKLLQGYFTSSGSLVSGIVGNLNGLTNWLVGAFQ